MSRKESFGASPPVRPAASRPLRGLPAGSFGGNAAPGGGDPLAAFVEPLVERGRHELGAEGPEVWDCWSLFRHAQAVLFGRSVPRVVVPKDSSIALCSEILASHPGRALWKRVEGPVHGGAVELTSVSTPLHVGLWLAVDRGLVFHCYEPAGVQLDTLLALRASGWRVRGFYDWLGEAA